MPSRSASAPLTFDLPVSLVGKIESCRKRQALKTASEVVRLALDGFDFDACVIARDPHRQVSVRLDSAQRATLKRFSRRKDASVGELVRVALEKYTSKELKSAGSKKKTRK